MEREAYKQAHDGCDKCPCCGIDKMPGHYTTRRFTENQPPYRNMAVDEYRCLVCGAEWESDPYEDKNHNSQKESAKESTEGIDGIGWLIGFVVIFMFLVTWFACTIGGYI